MLFLVHHAEAVDALIDPQRPLTARGREQAANIAARAAKRAAKPEVIWHSGKLRARQTAEYFWRACNPLAEFAASRAVQPGDPPEWASDVISADARDIMIVGHMPHLGRLLKLLVRDEDAVFPDHGCIALERREDAWVEVWREQPE